MPTTGGGSGSSGWESSSSSGNAKRAEGVRIASREPSTRTWTSGASRPAKVVASTRRPTLTAPSPCTEAGRSPQTPVSSCTAVSRTPAAEAASRTPATRAARAGSSRSARAAARASSAVAAVNSKVDSNVPITAAA
jgi:hypothetical protein